MPETRTSPLPEPVRHETAAFGRISSSAVRASPGKPNYYRIAHTAEFRKLRRNLRLFAFPMTVLFLAWYMTYVIVAAYLPDFMAIRITGEINVGLLMGVGQFVSTILIIVLYLRFADRHIDPLVEEIRSRYVGGERQ